MNGKWMLGFAVCGAVTIAVTLAWGQEQQPLRYHTSGAPHPLVGGLSPKDIELATDPPRDPALPVFKSRNPLFSKWSSPLAPSGFLWIGLDRTQEDGLYDRLFIDSNGNGRLEDETALGADSSATAWARFGPVKLVLGGKETPVTCHLNFMLMNRDGQPRFSVSSGGWYEGTVTVGQKKKHCVVLDQDANGTFNDKSIHFKDCDLIQISEEGAQDICLVGNYIQVDEELYRLEVAADGSYIRLAAANSVRFGTIKQQTEMIELIAGGENGMLTVKLEKGLGKLPVGKYRVYGWEVERDDVAGNRWKAKATSFGSPEVFEIREGEETRLDPGEPIVSTIETYRSGAQCTVRHSWRGRSGEQIRITRNGVDPPPAQVHIWNADNSYDRTFTFETG